MLRAIIVDDEELSVKRLKRILAESGEIGNCHTFQSPFEAYEYVKANPVDIAFLDISMPGLNGMKLSECLHELDDNLDIVFVTGYDEYAVKAFELSALDYLLKPVTAGRIAKMLEKLEKKHRRTDIKPKLSVLLFNGLKLQRRYHEEEPLKLRSPKTDELLAFLICKGTVSREEIIDTLWNGLEPEKAWKNLNSTLYYIRKAINTGRMKDCILTGKSEIRIDGSAIYCDLYEFERLLKQIRLAPERSVELFEQAETLYAGPLLKGKSYEWANERALRLEQDYIKLLEIAARFHQERNQPSQALYYFGEILKLDAFREDISEEMIRLYITLGRTSEALRNYHALEELLLKELGTKPNPKLTEFIMKLNR